MPRGNIHKKLCNGRPVFEWTIPDFFGTRQVRNEFSPIFEFVGNNWQLQLSTNKDQPNLDENWITIFLWRYPCMHPKSVWYTFGVKKAVGMEETIICDECMRQNIQTSGRRYLIPMSNLLRRESQLSVSGALIITCTLKDNPPASVAGQSFVSSETQTENLTDDEGAREDIRYLGTRGGTIQQKHFKDMLLKGQDHDVTLKVKDREFTAHKCVLRARSPVFAAMFTHNMKEAECGDVTIEDCDPTAFGEFLEYVYTGNVDNLTPSNALGLYYAGDKYDIPDLKEMCVEFLKTSLSFNVICGVIDMAIKHSEKDLLDCSMAFFTDHVMEIWQTVEWQRFLKRNSALANELNIKAMKSYHKNT